MRLPRGAFGITVVLELLAGACGGASTAQGPPSKRTSVESAKASGPARPKGVIYRDEVVKIVNGGLGRFLQHVDVEASLKGGKFEGFRIVELRPPGFWKGVDLGPGDVVTSVNGMPIEQPPDAYRAFQHLKTADELVITYLRGAEERRLVYRIVDRPRS
jgi:type II secretory pathway component PulC